jgi:hypothetical protein
MAATERMPFPGVIDADGHILEPPDLWGRYTEPRYRDRLKEMLAPLPLPVQKQIAEENVKQLYKI